MFGIKSINIELLEEVHENITINNKKIQKQYIGTLCYLIIKD